MPEKPGPDKSQLRSRLRSLRDAMDPDARVFESKAVTRRLLQSDLIAGASTVAVYRASEHELSVDGMVEELRRDDVRVVFPRVAGPRTLTLHEARDEEFAAGSFGISEPTEQSTEVDASEVDVVVVPGIAFDRRGFRLGYGGGYYDALLTKFREDCTTIGVCFDQQLLDFIPTEPHDVAVHYVVTPSEFIDNRGR